MLFPRIVLIAALGTLVAGSGLDLDDIDGIVDVARECVSVCAPVLTAGVKCSDGNGDDNEEILDCVCNTDGMDDDLPECEACLAPYVNDNDDFEDVTELRNYCGFQAAPAPISGDPSATIVVADENGTSTITTAAEATASASITVVQQNGNNAMVTAAPIVGVGAGIAVAALAAM